MFYLCYPYIYVSNVLVYPYPQSKENRFYILEAVYYDDKHKLDSVYNFVDSVVGVSSVYYRNVYSGGVWKILQLKR